MTKPILFGFGLERGNGGVSGPNYVIRLLEETCADDKSVCDDSLMRI
jgi:hypothetical protein